MKTITTEVYTITELSPEAKEKARDWWKQLNDMPWMEDAMQEHLQDLLMQNGMKCDDSKVYYSLSCCQGDGAMFEGSIVWGKYTIKVKQSGMYYHFNSKTIERISVTDTGEEPEDYIKIENDFDEAYVKVCRELERYGYDYIESEQSDENVDENLAVNEYTFTSDGKRFG